MKYVQIVSFSGGAPLITPSTAKERSALSVSFSGSAINLALEEDSFVLIPMSFFCRLTKFVLKIINVRLDLLKLN